MYLYRLLNEEMCSINNRCDTIIKTQRTIQKLSQSESETEDGGNQLLDATSNVGNQEEKFKVSTE